MQDAGQEVKDREMARIASDHAVVVQRVAELEAQCSGEAENLQTYIARLDAKGAELVAKDEEMRAKCVELAAKDLEIASLKQCQLVSIPLVESKAQVECMEQKKLCAERALADAEGEWRIERERLERERLVAVIMENRRKTEIRELRTVISRFQVLWLAAALLTQKSQPSQYFFCIAAGQYGYCSRAGGPGKAAL